MVSFFTVLLLCKANSILLSELQGILSPVYVDGHVLHNWKMFTIPLHNLSDQSSSIVGLAGSDLTKIHGGHTMQNHSSIFSLSYSGDSYEQN